MSTRTLPPGVDDYDNIDMEEEQPAHPGLNVNANTWNPETAFMDRVMTFMENNQRAQTADQRVKLATFWEKDPAAWFDLVEAEMEAKRMFDPHTRYRTVLTAIPVHITERIRGILNQARVAADPFLELKKRLIEMLTPSVLECCESILMGPELGGRRPSELMDTMLAALPVGEPAGYLFKTVFLNRLPADMRDLVALQFKNLAAKELAAYADVIWDVRNTKGKAVAAVTPGEQEATKPVDNESLLAQAIAALTVHGKKGGRGRGGGRGGRGGRKGGRGGGQGQGGGHKTGVSICERHLTFGKEAYSCDEPGTCQWPAGN